MYNTQKNNTIHYSQRSTKELTCFHLLRQEKHQNSDFTHLKLWAIHTHTFLFLCNQAQHGYLFSSFHKNIKYLLTWQIRGILCNSISNTWECLKTFRSSYGCPHTKRALLRCSTFILCSPETD